MLNGDSEILFDENHGNYTEDDCFMIEYRQVSRDTHNLTSIIEIKGSLLNYNSNSDIWPEWFSYSLDIYTYKTIQHKPKVDVRLKTLGQFVEDGTIKTFSSIEPITEPTDNGGSVVVGTKKCLFTYYVTVDHPGLSDSSVKIGIGVDIHAHDGNNVPYHFNTDFVNYYPPNHLGFKADLRSEGAPTIYVTPEFPTAYFDEPIKISFRLP